MSEPKWKCVSMLGDVDPINHGGKFVLVDEMGVHIPEMLVISKDLGCWEVARIELNECFHEYDILSDNSYHKDSEAWFADKIDLIAASRGMKAYQLIEYLCSTNPVLRAIGYEALVGFFGTYEFDQSPNELNRREINVLVKKYQKQLTEQKK